ncbi:hypothetical protein [Streptomyces sp. NPDC059761]|uniref:hypothetical protein n=1 Tax=unclassified Streptomyces TaxID=2593676 RepID=UPI00365B65CA
MSTAAWALIASIVGGIVGAGIKFTFEDLLGPRLGHRRDTRNLVSRFTTPLLRSAEQLERRINNLVRNEKEQWFEKDDYYQLSTLYVFGEHLGWIRIIERRFGFIPIESARRTRVFTARLYGSIRGLSSFQYFHSHQSADVGKSTIPRLMLTAIGEAMTAADRESVIEFTEFVTKYRNDPQFASWFANLELFLRRAHPRDPVVWDRVVITGAELRALIGFLDPKGRLARRRPLVNLDHLITPGLQAELTRELATWASTPTGSKKPAGVIDAGQ